jgi:thioredoxin-like negative regulator of GroEL
MALSAILAVCLSFLCANGNHAPSLLLPLARAEDQLAEPKASTTVGSKTSIKQKKSPEGLSLSVIDLTSVTFSSTVNDGNVWLIEFYTSWCKHCQNFKSSYSNIAHTFHSSPNEKIRVARVDCTAEKALATRFHVSGYPSFYVVSGYDVYEFEGTRSESGLIAFARGGYKQQDVSIYKSVMNFCKASKSHLVLSSTAHSISNVAHGTHGNAPGCHDLRRDERHGISRYIKG